EAVERRDIDVEQQQIELTASQLEQGIGAVGDRYGFVAGFAEESFDEGRGNGVVLDDQDEDRSIERLEESVAWRGSLAQRLYDLFAHAPRLGARRPIELASEDVAAFLIASQRGVGCSLLGLQTQRRSMDDCLGRCE